MNNEYALAIKAIKDPAGRFHDLPVAPSMEFGRPRPAPWMHLKLLDVKENAPDQLTGGYGILKRNVVGNGIEVAEGRIRPDYFSHRAILALARA